MKWEKIIIKDCNGNIVEALAPIIISVSRATDIPAFWSDWLIKNIKNGYIQWKNPFNGKITYISFEKVHLAVFWSKNPQPIIRHLPFFDKYFKNYYFQFTLNDYEKEKLEPGIPDLNARIETFINLSEKIGKEKVIWRFDPLLLTEITGIEELLEKIERIGNKLAKYTNKLVFSFADIDIYHKVKNNLQQNNVKYVEFNKTLMTDFARDLQILNKRWNLEISTCAEQIALENYGTKHNKCIDDDLIIKLFHNDKTLMDFLGVKITYDVSTGEVIYIEKKHDNKDKGQRKYCGCIISKDIGEYNTCPHFCKYCYANTSRKAVLKNISSKN